MRIPRKEWNSRQKQLQDLLADRGSHSQAIQLFLRQHAEVHSSSTSSFGAWSFQDEILADLTDQQIKELPSRAEHSIAWVIWHMARIEDVTMSMLVAGAEQLFTRDEWMPRLGIAAQHTGNAMAKDEIAALSEAIDVDGLLNYRAAVGRRTEVIAKELAPGDIRQKVSSSRLDRVVQAGVVRTEAKEIIEYWGRRIIAGLLLMPATRHCYLHLNEAERIRREIR